MKFKIAYHIVSSILKDETTDIEGKTFLILNSLKNGIDEQQNEETLKTFELSCFDKPIAK